MGRRPQFADDSKAARLAREIEDLERQLGMRPPRQPPKGPSGISSSKDGAKSDPHAKVRCANCGQVFEIRGTRWFKIVEDA